jgi:hypothetical protein
MGIELKLRRKIEPKLKSGELLEEVFLARSGLSPYLLALTYVLFFRMKYWVFAVTDRRIVVFRSSVWIPSAVKGEARDQPRDVFLDLQPGIWGKLIIDGEQYWVHRVFERSINSANSLRPSAR